MSKTRDHKNQDESDFIFRASITLKNGKKLFAHQCGLKAFKIPIKAGNDNKKS